MPPAKTLVKGEPFEITWPVSGPWTFEPATQEGPRGRSD
jgi:hypothetical protein